MTDKNHEGYSDPTAGKAIKEVRKDEVIADKNHKLMKSIRCIVDLAGFEIIGRITLKHKKSGKIFK